MHERNPFEWNTRFTQSEETFFCERHKFGLKELSGAISCGQWLRGIYLKGNYPWDNYPGSKCPEPIYSGQLPGGQLFGGQLSWEAIAREAIFLGSNCPGQLSGEQLSQNHFINSLISRENLPSLLL